MDKSFYRTAFDECNNLLMLGLKAICVHKFDPGKHLKRIGQFYVIMPVFHISLMSVSRAEEVVIIRLCVESTKATKSHTLTPRTPTTCHHYGQTLTIDLMLLECASLQESRDDYCAADALNTFFGTIPDKISGILLLLQQSLSRGQYSRAW